MANLATALIYHDRIETTLVKAKALKPFVEKIITLAKKASALEDKAQKLHLKRLAMAKVRNKAAVDLLFTEKVKAFLARSGGYTRIYKLGNRVGDAADVALICFVPASDADKTTDSVLDENNQEPALATAVEGDETK
jgi:large subunit ribosomal protein L17